jgi:serine/threonine protein kinase
MGSVFVTIRADREFEMKVAIKVMRGSMATPALIEHFRSERRILARLEHPHIARLLDAGLTETGLPYMVMEYVDGLPVTKYLDQARATIEERLRMFRLVCSAVHHAHQRLVVYRDIKPGNGAAQFLVLA